MVLTKFLIQLAGLGYACISVYMYFTNVVLTQVFIEIKQGIYSGSCGTCIVLFKGIRLLKAMKALRAANIKHISVSTGCNTLEIESGYCILRLYLDSLFNSRESLDIQLEIFRKGKRNEETSWIRDYLLKYVM